MKTHFIKWYHYWKELLKEKKFRISLIVGIGVLMFAFIVNYRAAAYTSTVRVLSVGDLILDYIPTMDLTYMYTFGIYVTAAVIFLYPILYKPELAPFTFKTVAAFILIRSFFISLTHLGAPANYFALPQMDDQPGLFRLFYMNDLFFSGHTGFPFLGALLFWENKYLRWILIAMSAGQAVTVLFMHVHYSIDVFSAWFITYAIYEVSDKVFNKLNLSFRAILAEVERRLKAIRKI